MGRIELFDRSRGAEGGGRGRSPGREKPRGRNDAAEHLAGRLGGERIGDGRASVLKVTRLLPKEYSHGAVDLGALERLDSDLLRVLFPRAEAFLLSGGGLGDLVFFDIETTGLSGGAGTLVFLAGTVRAGSEGVRVTQYFLESLSAERLFLALLTEELGRGNALVSFNGRSFDYNIIKNRLIMNGFRLPERDPHHFDLLYPARRIWKGRLPDFTLQTLERRVCGVERAKDIPGSLIPEVYFRYLSERGGGEELAGDLDLVFAHNRTDILSLPALLVRQLGVVGRHLGHAAQVGDSAPGAGARVREPLTRPVMEGSVVSAETPVNPGSLSDMFVRSNFSMEAKRLLREHSGDREALWKLGMLCKRERLFHEASEAFRVLLERGSLGEYVSACAELAKLFEHGLRDFAEAKRYAELALRRIDRARFFAPHHEELIRVRDLQRGMDELGKRLLRLNRKLGLR